MKNNTEEERKETEDGCSHSSSSSCSSLAFHWCLTLKSACMLSTNQISLFISSVVCFFISSFGRKAKHASVHTHTHTHTLLQGSALWKSSFANFNQQQSECVLVSPTQSELPVRDGVQRLRSNPQTSYSSVNSFHGRALSSLLKAHFVIRM